jgi:hypothetical protein
MSPAGFTLGIDFGTSNTVAMLRWPDGRIKPLLFDGSPLLPSAVFAAADGRLIVGRDALHHARFAPASLEPNPKRRIDEDWVLLGEREVEVTDLVTAVLRYVYQEAVRVTGGTVPAVALAHPAGWGPVRRLVLADAARAAGLGEPTFIPEPAAAAHYFTAVLGHRIPPGGHSPSTTSGRARSTPAWSGAPAVTSRFSRSTGSTMWVGSTSTRRSSTGCAPGPPPRARRSGRGDRGRAHRLVQQCGDLPAGGVSRSVHGHRRGEAA